MALIIKRASDEMTPLEDVIPAQHAGDATSRLSTAEVAKLLGMSRPYVTMLFDAGKLGAIETTEGGHRRIQREAVELYKSQSQTRYNDAPSMREAGVEAHLYDHDDRYYANVVRDQDAVQHRTNESKLPTKKARP